MLAETLIVLGVRNAVRLAGGRVMKHTTIAATENRLVPVELLRDGRGIYGVRRVGFCLITKRQRGRAASSRNRIPLSVLQAL